MIKRGFREKSALIFFSLWLTVLGIRSFLFEAWGDDGHYPALFINGIHVHHFIIGFFFLLIASVLYYGLRKRYEFFTLLLLGSGLGLIFDEFTYWTRFQFDYWGIQNFWLTVAIALIFLFLAIFPEREPRDRLIPKTIHRNPLNPSVSVVIPAFNEGKFLAKSLDSFSNQDYTNFELIVVDNNSTDDTAEIAKNFGAKVIFEPRQGVGAARDRGFREARGEIIATTDADTIVPEDWLSRIGREFESDKKLVAFGGFSILYSGPLLARVALAYFTYPIFLVERIFSGGWSIAGANLAVRKSAFLEIGGFRTDLHVNEDLDLSQRIAAVGKVRLDPDFLVKTSGRRYKHGLIWGLTAYFPVWASKVFFKRERRARLSTIRHERSLLRGLSFLPLILSGIFLFSLFSFQNPTIAQARAVEFTREKISLAERKLKLEKQELRHSLAGIKRPKIPNDNSFYD